MGVYDSYKKHKAKKEQQNEPSPMPVAPAPQTPAADPVPAPGDVNTPDAMPQAPAAETPTAPVAETRAVNGSPNSMPEVKQSLTSVAAKPDLTIEQDKTPAWVKAGSYEDLVKINPNWSRGQYAYELGKYRRENGMPDLSYAEWANIIKGQDPYETEAERQKREKNMRTASQINALGSFLNALVNYNRVKSGHVGYTPDKGTEAYNRLERMRLGQEQLARSNARDYLGALAQDRAERAKEAAAADAAKEKERNYEIKKADLEWKIQNAKNEAGRKAAADELARLKFEHQKAKDAAALNETKRHNQASEAISRERAKNGGGSGKIATTAMSADGRVWTRNSPLSKEEAMQLVMGSEYGKDKDFLDNFRSTVTTLGEDGETIRKGEVNWYEAAASLMADKKIPATLLSEMGYKGEFVDSPKSKKVDGFPSGTSEASKTVSGFGS